MGNIKELILERSRIQFMKASIKEVNFLRKLKKRLREIEHEIQRG